MRTCLTYLLPALLAGALLMGCTPGEGASEETEVQGEVRSLLATVTPGPSPTVALTTLEGETVSLEQWRGKTIILNFWATWCYPCRIEMPDLAAFHEGQSDVVVVGVNYEEGAELARPFVEELGLPFPILLDTRGELGEALGVRGLPTTFFINAQGQVVGSHMGPLTHQTLDAILERLSLSPESGG